MQWSEVISNPLLQNLPFKIELNKFGQLLMTPASNLHGSIKANLAIKLFDGMPEGEVITGCSIETSDGVKVADVVWASAAFIKELGYSTPYIKAPELCIEIVSPSYSKQAMKQKTDLYFARGAQEVWIANEDANIAIFTHTGQQSKSNFFDTPSIFDKDFMTDRFDDLPQERLAHIRKLQAEIAPNTITADDIAEAIKQGRE